MKANGNTGRQGLSRDMQLHLGRCIRETSEPIVREGLPSDIRRLLDAMDGAAGRRGPEGQHTS